MIMKRRWAGSVSLLTILVGLLATATTAQSVTQCFISMVIADRDDPNSIDHLSRDEYVVFLSRLSGNSRDFVSFDMLLQNLQENFTNLAGEDGQINIFGAKPGQNEGGDDQERFLEQVCSDTTKALTVAFTPTSAPISAPVPVPVPAPSSPRPTRPLSQCFAGLMVNDRFPRNMLLDEEEYVGFLNFLEPGSFDGLAYVQLPLTLQSNFANLASESNSIDLSGLPSPPPDQTDFLETVCDITNVAIGIVLQVLPTIPVTRAPTTSAPVVLVIPDGSPPPVAMAPITSASDTISPATLAPGTSSPVAIGLPTVFPTTSPSALGASGAPVTFAPAGLSATGAPNTAAPITAAPNTAAPITAAPITFAPASLEPTTVPTMSPTTFPTTSPPINVTLAPVTLAPVATGSIITGPQTTSPPVITPRPTSSGGAAVTISVTSGLAATTMTLVSVWFESYF